MTPSTMDLAEQWESISRAIEMRKSIPTISERVVWLEKASVVEDYFRSSNPVTDIYPELSPQEKWCVCCLAFLGQGDVVFNPFFSDRYKLEELKPLLAYLWEVEQFYDGIGGVLGYHAEVLHCLTNGDVKDPEIVATEYRQPQGVSFVEDKDARDQAIRWGIEGLPKMGEIYVVGGAGDRLDLRDPATGEPLPAGMLPFCGRTLIDVLVRDLQAREELYTKLTGKTVTTPIALMTSPEKENDRYIRQLFAEKKWFGRPQETVFFFQQPLAPVITEAGNWSMQGPLRITLKPGGHGVLWRLAKEHGVFDWFQKQGRGKVLVRQVNNPIAGCDNTLLSFAGWGLGQEKQFGFASCPRKVGAAEGTDVVVEEKRAEGYRYTLTNIEYVEFAKKNIDDHPKEPGSPYSLFPTNTNILFADLDAMEKGVEHCPFPGMTINMKKTAPYIDPHGKRTDVRAGRLESMMQNIAEDFFLDTGKRLADAELQSLPSYITFNSREKTISVTKNPYREGKDPHETPFGAWMDLMKNNRLCLTDFCGFTMPEWQEEAIPFHVLLHPALGPLYSIVGQKIRGGELSERAEWIAEISELDVTNLSIDGSLHLIAANPLSSGGRCTLRNVQILNQGIGKPSFQECWQNDWMRDEFCRIEIEGTGELVAENVCFTGRYHVKVPDGVRVTAFQEGERVSFQEERISKPTWSWKASWNGNQIELKKKAAG